MKLLLGGSDEINQDLQKIKNHQKMFVEAADPHDKIHPRKGKLISLYSIYTLFLFDFQILPNYMR